jgi:hypothetical protein
MSWVGPRYHRGAKINETQLALLDRRQEPKTFGFQNNPLQMA